MTKTTLNKLKHDKCYCLKKQENINIIDCSGFECNRWKKCMTKTNSDVNKEIMRNQKK